MHVHVKGFDYSVRGVVLGARRRCFEGRSDLLKHLLQAALAGILLFVAAPQGLRAETGEDAWLRYAPLDRSDAARYDWLPASVTVAGDSAVLATARDELIRGVQGMLGTECLCSICAAARSLS